MRFLMIVVLATASLVVTDCSRMQAQTAEAVGAPQARVRNAMRRATLKAFLRREANSRTTDPKTRADIQTLLNNDSLLDQTYDEVGGEFDRLSAGALQDFLQWLVDNRESILEFVKAIIALFAQDSQMLGPAPAFSVNGPQAMPPAGNCTPHSCPSGNCSTQSAHSSQSACSSCQSGCASCGSEYHEDHSYSCSGSSCGSCGGHSVLRMRHIRPVRGMIRGTGRILTLPFRAIHHARHRGCGGC